MAVETLRRGRPFFNTASAEAVTPPARVSAEVQVIAKHGSVFEYPACAGKVGSSEGWWVPADWLAYRFAKLLHVTDEDIKKNTSR